MGTDQPANQAVIEFKIVGVMNYDTGRMDIHIEGPLDDIFTCDGMLSQARRLLDKHQAERQAQQQGGPASAGPPPLPASTRQGP